MTLAVLFAGAVLLAWSNGANDNFKGVATLYGSGTTDFHHALVWATAATTLGSLVSVFLANGLAIAYSGAGLIPDEPVETGLLAAVAGAAAVTILLATWLGMPTSTTHALTGALVGAALATAGPAAIDWQRLGMDFGQPLLLSPVLAVVITAAAYLVLKKVRARLAFEEDTCVCIGETAVPSQLVGAEGQLLRASLRATGIDMNVGTQRECDERFSGSRLSLGARRVVDVLHFLSGGAVCIARAVNDTPKIAALLMIGSALGMRTHSAGRLALVALTMAAGGWLQSRRVAETMSHRITDLNPGQGLTANLITAGLVLGASRLGLPVSTTHVSCGSIFGIGLADGRMEWRTVAQILVTWLTTLPLALALGFLLAHLLE